MSTDTLAKNALIASKEKRPAWRAEVLNGLLKGGFIFGLLAAIVAINDTFRDPSLHQQLKLIFVSLYIASVLLLGIITFIRHISYALRVGALLFLLYGFGLSNLIASGLNGDGRAFILAFIVMAAILFDIRYGIIALIIGTSTLASIAWLFSAGAIATSAERLANSTNPNSWVSGSLILVLLAITIIAPIAYLIRNFETQLKKASDLLDDAKNTQGNLSQLADARTSELEHRTKQLEIASRIAHDALLFQSTSELLLNVTHLISERFGFYHTGIFLLGEKEEYAILQSASSDGGQKMLENGYQLRVGSEGAVGATAAEKRPHIALDVGEGAVFFNNPNLPETRSEIALPLISQNNVIGVLNIQSKKAQAFTPQDIEVFQTLTNQLTLAIQNAYLLEEAQENLAQLETLTATQSQAAWQARLEQKSHGFLYTPLGIKNLKNQERINIEKDKENADIPIILRGNSIGKIILKRPSRQWADKEKALIADISEQVGLAIENARLVDETRDQANRDQLVSEFSTKLRETLDMDTVVKTAIEEIKETFNLKEVEVRLNTIQDHEFEN